MLNPTIVQDIKEPEEPPKICLTLLLLLHCGCLVKIIPWVLQSLLL